MNQTFYKRQSRRGFSLVEVVVAVGIFAIAIVGVMGLLSPSIKAVGDISDTNLAARLADNIQSDLEQYGFTNVVALTSSGTLQLVASKDGLRVARSNGTTPPADNDSVSGNPPGIKQKDRYYKIEVTRFPTGNTLAYDPAKSPGFIALSVRVIWPYQLPQDSTDAFVAANANSQSSTIFNFAIRP